ncbi:single-pass membrane and coiled-coil domain-containing protein 3 [Mixophyes fleayi]|uniref:single-pass membrane and coiled-coil domain-containing protein 3 n=1 Tax=Mixophyes fleayi TaxID=3061075 RepID=UPI003F4D7927
MASVIRLLRDRESALVFFDPGRMVPPPSSEASTSTINGSPGSGFLRTGADVKAALRAVKLAKASEDQLAVSAPFREDQVKDAISSEFAHMRTFSLLTNYFYWQTFNSRLSIRPKVFEKPEYTIFFGFQILLFKMTLKDLIYPNNPKKRDEVARLHFQLLHCMRGNFQQTKQLILTLNKHFDCQLGIPEIRDNASIKENCDTFIKNMADIQEQVQKIDDQLKIILEPILYEKLHDIKESEPNKIEIAQKVVSVILSKATTSASAVIVKLISSNITTILANKLMTLLAQIGASVLGAVGIAVLGLGIDVIIGAILGAVERDKLECSVKEYEMYLADFKPASEAYQEAILSVTSKLENMFQHVGMSLLQDTYRQEG